MELFKVKCRLDKVQDTGLIKKVTEEHLFEAVNWGDAETIAYAEIAAFTAGEFAITDISMFKVQEIFETTATKKGDDFFYKARLNYITLDEKSGKEKKQGVNFLVIATDLEDAKNVIVESMKESMIDYTIQKIEETKILSLTKASV